MVKTDLQTHTLEYAPEAQCWISEPLQRIFRPRAFLFVDTNGKVSTVWSSFDTVTTGDRISTNLAPNHTIAAIAVGVEATNLG